MPLTAGAVIVWFRRDFRLQDNPALMAAHKQGGPILPLYIHDESAEGEWRTGGASRWWLHHALASLDEALRSRGSRLLILLGDTAKVMSEMVTGTRAQAIYYNRRYEPAIIARDTRLKRELISSGIEIESFNGNLLFEPHTIANKQGKPFQVFTPFWRHCLTLPVSEPVEFNARKLTSPIAWPESLPLAKLALLPLSRWDREFSGVWQPGESNGQTRLKKFLAESVDGYAEDRNQPALDGTSGLSPWLHFGQLSPRQIWAGVRDLGKGTGVFPSSRGAQVFLSEVGWREFAHHLLYHYPHTPTEPMRPDFNRFSWARDTSGKKLQAWQKGLTGYPIVDAGMRQLWRTGWMHNRVRMITASFLVKHLRLPWPAGAAWFWDTLVDADLANNTLGWQWSAGCGADAAPYFRIFAPVTQGERYDAGGEYVRRWVPELAAMPVAWIHRPWEAPIEVLADANVRLGDNYPRPMVDHATARAAALAAFKKLRSEQPA
ncbi:MAG: DNA photolyase family protein [Cephaloticoccus sp.]|nr:DNA photolyase family protein [Cephaloticoccus sp.]MCF7760969.1 DNA photolyase family protein [Cephaloticoccus sp.]